MDVINDDAKGDFRRVEILTGPARRRRWSAAEKGRIVAESLQAGVSVTEVARRWQICPQQVWGWRREARAGALTLPSNASMPAKPLFVPIIAEPAVSKAAEAGVPTPKLSPRSDTPVIEFRLAGAVVRLGVGPDCKLLAEVLRAERASAT
jgi:transposase